MESEDCSAQEGINSSVCTKLFIDQKRGENITLDQVRACHDASLLKYKLPQAGTGEGMNLSFPAKFQDLHEVNNAGTGLVDFQLGETDRKEGSYLRWESVL